MAIDSKYDLYVQGIWWLQWSRDGALSAMGQTNSVTVCVQSINRFTQEQLGA